MSLGTIKNSLLLAVVMFSLSYTTVEAQMRLGSRIRAMRCARAQNHDRLQCSRYQHSCCWSDYSCCASATKSKCRQIRSCQQTCDHSCCVATCKKRCCQSSSCCTVVKCCCKAKCCNRPPCQEPQFSNCIFQTGDFAKCYEEFCYQNKSGNNSKQNQVTTDKKVESEFTVFE